jgi:hypothetical protein|tara:strand:+ start:67 stop:540 length:474 start_codon:yes stop_codon:yes gene_type:complete
MKFANKEFAEYWKIIKIPTYVLIAWGILGFIMSIISFQLYMTVFSSSSSLILTIVIFGFIGWTAIKDHNQTVKIAAWSGALTGAITGFIGAIIGIFMFYLVPEIIQLAMAQAGANAAAVEGFIKIGVYLGLITGPLISAIIGAIIALIAALIAKKIK